MWHEIRVLHSQTDCFCMHSCRQKGKSSFFREWKICRSPLLSARTAFRLVFRHKMLVQIKSYFFACLAISFFSILEKKPLSVALVRNICEARGSGLTYIRKQVKFLALPPIYIFPFSFTSQSIWVLARFGVFCTGAHCFSK